MNLALTDPFILAQDYPEALTGKLSSYAYLAEASTYADLFPCRIWPCYMPSIQSQRGSPCFRSGKRVCITCLPTTDILPQVDGAIVIFDVETSEVARKLRGHTRQIQSIRYYQMIYHRYCWLTETSWSRDGRFLLSSSQDWKCILWDVKDGTRARIVRFEAPVYIAELHPYNQYVHIVKQFYAELSECRVSCSWLHFSKTSRC